MQSILHFQKKSNWLPIKKEGIIISGPCSAESPEQLLATAEQLALGGRVDILRAGIWKPRTRPNTFEGMGKEALTWLVEVGKETQLKTSTEVATPLHVEQALASGIDYLWIGARTTTNPFSIQAISDALRGIDIPVMVKNPINPDLNLWIGALERINGAGITKLGAIHRGFSTFHKQYRNAPMWEIPLQLKTIFPDLPILSDPSHISGTRTHLSAIAQKAMDIGMDGLMIESHIQPHKALSDADQQITPSQLLALLDTIEIKGSHTKFDQSHTPLEVFRSRIDHIDNELLSLIAERMDTAHKIGSHKKTHQDTPFQLDRWKEILHTRLPFAVSKGLDADFSDKLIQLLHEESLRIQLKIFDSPESP